MRKKCSARVIYKNKSRGKNRGLNGNDGEGDKMNE
jgi:hypothetical protein